MSQPTAKIIKDSITDRGHRITTMEVVFHRFVLAEFNTHRVFSRNSASSRAIPLAKQIARIEEQLAYPLAFPGEQRGMSGNAEVDHSVEGRRHWLRSAKQAIIHAKWMGDIGVHKSIANRMLEPYGLHTAVVTATAWTNFFDQRCSPLAQPEIRAVADLMRSAYAESVPQVLFEGSWHLPYVTEEEISSGQFSMADLVKISSARCAQLSYLTQPVVVDGEVVDPGGKIDPEKDLNRYQMLMGAAPRHWSPLEHPATPCPQNVQSGILEWEDGFLPLDHLPKVGNLTGWRSQRLTEEARAGELTFR